MRNLSTTMTEKKMPTNLIALGELSGAVVLQTANINQQTFAWLVEDDRYLVAIDGNDQNESACKEWFHRWFKIEDEQQIKIYSGRNDMGEIFTIQIKNDRHA